MAVNNIDGFHSAVKTLSNQIKSFTDKQTSSNGRVTSGEEITTLTKKVMLLSKKLQGKLKTSPGEKDLKSLIEMHDSIEILNASRISLSNLVKAKNPKPILSSSSFSKIKNSIMKTGKRLKLFFSNQKKEVDKNGPQEKLTFLLKGVQLESKVNKVLFASLVSQKNKAIASKQKLCLNIKRSLMKKKPIGLEEKLTRVNKIFTDLTEQRNQLLKLLPKVSN